jgi:hypothetical protein
MSTCRWSSGLLAVAIGITCQVALLAVYLAIPAAAI